MTFRKLKVAASTFEERVGCLEPGVQFRNLQTRPVLFFLCPTGAQERQCQRP